MKLKRGAAVGIIAGILTLLSSFLFITVFDSQNLFYFLFGLGFLISILPFVILSVVETKSLREKDEMFLEFSRNLVENVESGTPISKGIINMRYKNFGSLSPHVEKLANQIELGIPIQEAFEFFAKDTQSKTIMRAVTLIREADRTGGNIEVILESVAKSISEIEKLKAERRASISSIVVEGYIIFLIFIIIMIVMEVQIIPMTSGLAEISGDENIAGAGSFGIASMAINPSEFSIAFLSLLIVQGLFAGLIIGKLAEGNIKAGIKHSFFMVAMALLISTGSKLILIK